MKKDKEQKKKIKKVEQEKKKAKKVEKKQAQKLETEQNQVFIDAVCKLVEAAYEEYVPEGHRVDVYVVPEDSPEPWKEDDLDSRDLTPEDIFDMMLDEEIGAYDYLDNLAHEDPADLPKDSDSLTAIQDNHVDLPNRKDIAIEIAAGIRAAAERFAYAVNAGASEDLIKQEEEKLETALEEAMLWARMYEFEYRREQEEFEMERSRNEFSEHADNLIDIESGYEDAWTAIEQFSEEHYGEYKYEEDN